MSNVKTPYGLLPVEKYKEFCDIAGYRWDKENKSWVIISDEVEYYQLQNANATTDANKWKKKKGWLSIRDLNFEYALYKTEGNLVAALRYAKDRLFGADGVPVYLPDLLGVMDNIEADRKPRGYNQILKEEQAIFKQKEDARQKATHR